MKTVAISAKGNLGEALEKVIGSRTSGVSFKHIDKISEKTPDAILGSLFLPSYVSSKEVTKVAAVNTRIDQNATEESRKKQWDTIRSPHASVEEIIAELGYVNEYTIIPSAVSNEMKLALGDMVMAFGEADDDAAKVAALRPALDLLKKVLA